MKSFKILLASLFVLLFSTTLSAKTAAEIDLEANVAIQQFNKEIEGSATFLESAKGILIFPKVVKAGLVIGGEYGEGVLRVNGKSAQYYSTASASIGLQLGVQKKTIVIVFLTDDALSKFRKNDGWEIGVDGSVVLVDMGAGKDINSATMNKPIVGFVYGSKGLMYNLTLEGSKFTKIVR